MTQPLTLPRIVTAPSPVGPGAVNRIVSVLLEDDEDVIWELPWLPDDPPPIPLHLGSSGA